MPNSYYQIFRNFFFRTGPHSHGLLPLVEQSVLRAENWIYVSFKIDPELDGKRSKNDRKAFPKVYMTAVNGSVVLEVKPPIVNFSDNLFRGMLENHFEAVFGDFLRRHRNASLNRSGTDKPRVTIHLTEPSTDVFNTLLGEIETTLAEYCKTWKILYHGREHYGRELSELRARVDTEFLNGLLKKSVVPGKD